MAENPDEQPLRVLFLSVAGEIGGAERSLLELVQALPRGEIVPHVAVPPGTPLAAELSRAGIAVHPILPAKLRRTLNPLLIYKQTRVLHRCATAVAAACVEQRITAVHANTDTAALVAWRGAKAAGVPYVWHCRDMTRSRTVLKILGGSAARIVAISAAVERHLRAAGVPANKLVRIVNGIALRRFDLPKRNAVRERVRRALEIGAEQTLLLSIGGFVPWKRHEDFLEMLAALRARGLDVVGAIAGSDLFKQNAAYEKRLRQRVAALGLENGVRFLGQRDDIPELLVAADVVVSCSENEPFGRVLAEAGAAGVPVVATDSGGKAEIVADGRSGLLVPHGDSAALAAACARLVVNPALRATMGAAAREHAAAYFNITRAAAEIAALHREIAQA